jgi:hypothetical protein
MAWALLCLGKRRRCVACHRWRVIAPPPSPPHSPTPRARERAATARPGLSVAVNTSEPLTSTRPSGRTSGSGSTILTRPSLLGAGTCRRPRPECAVAGPAVALLASGRPGRGRGGRDTTSGCPPPDTSLRTLQGAFRSGVQAFRHSQTDSTGGGEALTATAAAFGSTIRLR